MPRYSNPDAETQERLAAEQDRAPRPTGLFDGDEMANLIGPICELADLPTSSETPGVARDDEMDVLIMAARRIVEREGFLVTDGSELDA